MIDNRLVFTPDQDWVRRGNPRTAGSLLAVSLNVLRPPTDGNIFMSTEADIVLVPTPRQSIEEVAVMDEKIVATVYDNVIGHVVSFNNNATRPWTQTVLPAADNAAVHLGSFDRKSGRLFYSFEGFLTPQTLAIADLNQSSANVIRSAPARFDASKDVVEQFEALQRRDEDPLFRGPSQGRPHGRIDADDHVRLRRLPDRLSARLQARDGQAVARERRRLRHRQHPRRRRVRPRLA
jgi:prolyl oligopeptidase PreP (S9A serine peptidase family)